MPVHRDPTPSAFSTELQMLLAGIGHFRNEDAAAQLTPFLNASIDWKYLLALAERHRVAPLLRRGLAGFPPERMPADFVKELHDSYVRSAVNAMVLGEEQRQVLSLLAAQGIPAMPYKGVLLGEQLYGDAALRPTGDIDLIVRKDDVVRAKECIGRRGYEPDHPFHSSRQEALYVSRNHEYELVHPNGHRVEIHWDVSGPEQGYRVAWDDVWERADLVEWNGLPVHCLSPEDLLVILAIHGGKHQWSELRWLSDIAALLAAYPNLAWPLVRRRAGEWRAARATQLALALVGQLWAAPSEVGCSDDDSLADLVGEVMKSLESADPLPSSNWRRLAFRLQLQDARADRWRLARQWIFALNYQDLSASESSQLGASVYRPVRLVRKRGWSGVVKILQQMGRGLHS